MTQRIRSRANGGGTIDGGTQRHLLRWPFITGELTQMMSEGVSYLKDVGNYFDALIM